MRLIRHMPHGLYEILPYAYMGVGVVVMITLQNIWSVASGFMLMVAGVMVWWTRRTHRDALRLRLERHTQLAGQPKHRDHGLARLTWDRSYECGNATVDAQHRRLFELGNGLLNAIVEGKPKLDIEFMLDDLMDDMAKHFSTEETLLLQAGHPQAEEHRDEHRRLLARCKEMTQKFHEDQIKANVLHRYLTREVLADHIISEDVKCLRDLK